MINRTKQVFWGFTSSIFWDYALVAAAFFSIPVILQFISKPLYGFWITALSILGYLGIMDLSLGMSLGHFVARMPEREGKAFDQLVNAAFFSFLGIGLLILVIGLWMSSYIPGWFNIPGEDAATVILAFCIAVAGLAISLPLSTFGGVITGGQHMAVSITINAVSALLGIALSIILVFNGLGLISLAIAHIFKILIAGLMGYLFCKLRYYPKLVLSPFFIKRDVVKRLASYGGFLQLGRIANTVILSTDAILIAAILGAGEVPAYAFTSKLAVLVSASLISKLPSALFPALSQMYANGEMEKIQSIFVRLAGYSIRVSIVFGCFLVIGNKEFVSLWVGSDFFAGNALNLIFIFWIFMDSLYRGTGIVIKASGTLKEWSFVSIVEALLNLGISIFLGIKIGLVGIALGTAISRTVSGVWFMKIACDKTQFSIPALIQKGIFPPMLHSIPSCCVIVIFAFLVPQSLGWFWVGPMILLGIITNILSFEGLELMRSPEAALKDRFRNLFVLKSVG